MDDYNKQYDKIKSKRNFNILLTVIIIIAATLFYRFSNYSSADFKSETDSMTFTDANGQTYNALYSEVVSMTYIDDPDYGTAVSGGTSKNDMFGNWQSDDLGEYRAFCKSNISGVVMIKMENGDCLAFNYENEDTTREFAESYGDYAAGF